MDDRCNMTYTVPAWAEKMIDAGKFDVAMTTIEEGLLFLEFEECNYAQEPDFEAFLKEQHIPFDFVWSAGDNYSDGRGYCRYVDGEVFRTSLSDSYAADMLLEFLKGKAGVDNLKALYPLPVPLNQISKPVRPEPTKFGDSYSKLPDGLYLGLYHGRKYREQVLSGWGIPGPVLGPLKFIETTYADTVKFDFVDKAAADRCGLDVENIMETDSSMLYHDGVWYGDWRVFTIINGKVAPPFLPGP